VEDETLQQQEDYEGYTKSLEKILDGVTKDYWATRIDDARHQVGIAKTYLWVSAALIGAYVTAYEKFHDYLLNYSCLILLGGMSFLLCCIAF
jgi:hypothetical protein